MIRDFVEGIMNGLKRAVLFVVDVLLFIPRLIVGGIVGFLVKEVKAAAIEEDEVEEEPDEDDEEPDEDDEEEEEESDEDDDDTDKVSRILKKSLNPSDQEIPIAVALSTAAAAAAPEEPDTPKEAEEDEKDDSEEESSSSEKKKTTPAKKTKASSKPEKVEGEVIEVFGKSDSKAAQYETAFMNFFNNASAKYAKDQWVDGLQKFARSFLDALSIKEGITPLKGKDVTADKRYKDLLDKLDSKIKFTEDEKKKLEICLGCQGRTSESAVRPQMEVAFKLINTYQAHYYEAWVQMQKATA